MKRRATWAAWCLGAALAAAPGAAWAQAKGAPSSGAQPAAAAAPTADVEALTDKARQLYEEGTKAAALGRWADARASFLAAWKLKEHYQIASNLGTAELKLGKHRDAAEHLSWYLREAPATKVQEKQKAEALLQEALAKIEAATVQVAPDGAEVWLDGQPVGKAPLAGPVFLEPGEHEIQAAQEGYLTAKQKVTAKAGAAETVKLALEVLKAAPAQAAGAEGSAAAAETPAPVKQVGRPSKKVVIGGLIATGVALGVGAVTGIVSNAKTSDADSLHDKLQSRSGSDACDVAANKADCDKLHGLRSDAWSLTNAARIGFGVAAVAGVATGVYYLVATRPAATTARVQAAPMIASGVGGVMVSGAW